MKMIYTVTVKIHCINTPLKGVFNLYSELFFTGVTVPAGINTVTP